MREMSYQTLNRPIFIMWGLSLFSLSLALSKSATNVSMGVAYLSVFVALTRSRSFRDSLLLNIRQPLLPAFGVYLGAAVLGLLFTQNVWDGIGIASKLSGLLLAYLMVSVLLDYLGNGRPARHNGERLLIAFLIGIFVLDVIGVLTYLGVIGRTKYYLPLAPLHVHHIWFSNLNAIGMYTAVSFLLFSTGRNDFRMRTFLYSILLLEIFSVLLSLSRTAWAGMIATVIVLSYLYIRKRKIFFVALASVFGTVFLLYLFNDIVQTRLNLIVTDIASFVQGNPETNIGTRFLMWKASLRMFLSNPIFGAGTGDYVWMMRTYVNEGAFPEFLLEFNQPHNIYFFALATNGLLGLSALLFIFYSGLRFTVSMRNRPGQEQMFVFLAISTIVHFMIAGITDSFFNIQILRYTFAFVMGVCVRNSLNADCSS